MNQLADNVSYMKDFQPFTSAEYKAVERVREILKQQDSIPCTACRYCVPGCPKHIPIPGLVRLLQRQKTVWRLEQRRLLRKPDAERGKSIGVHRLRPVRAACPQHLPVIRHLKETAALFETQA